jgi:hypothetical protein
MPQPFKAAAITVGLALVLGPLPSSATPADGRSQLTASECMYPGHVRSWSLLQDSRVLVDAGRRQFVIELQEGCPGLGHNPFLGFITNHPGGRICGQNGDRLIPHGSAATDRSPCAIRDLRAISKDDYGRYLQQRTVPVSMGQAS